jgi:hypothetical protein
MATKTLRSLKGRVMRLTRLDECGEPVIGTCSTIVTAGFISVTFEPELEEGEEYVQKNAWGDPCTDEKDRDRTKWFNIGLVMCEIHPDVLDMVAGATKAIAGADNVGAAFGPNGNLDSFALEVWTKQAGQACSGGALTWGYFVAPFITNGSLDGGWTIENGTMNMSLKGQAQLAPASWGITPYDDNPYLVTGGFPADHFVGQVLTTVQPPAATAGCVALAA